MCRLFRLKVHVIKKVSKPRVNLMGGIAWCMGMHSVRRELTCFIAMTMAVSSTRSLSNIAYVHGIAMLFANPIMLNTESLRSLRHH